MSLRLTKQLIVENGLKALDEGKLQLQTGANARSRTR